jgi:hypothetical protein
MQEHVTWNGIFQNELFSQLTINGMRKSLTSATQVISGSTDSSSYFYRISATAWNVYKQWIDTLNQTIRPHSVEKPHIQCRRQ